ncbi:MAG: pyruvate kinase [Dissulfurispiraceae bacterium]
MKLPTHKTKIVCTIGPASQSPEVMEQMLLAGMNIARLNFSHSDFQTHGKVIEDLKAAARRTGCSVTIMADLSGPKMRIGELVKEPIVLKSGDTFTLTTDDIAGDEERVSVTFNRLPQSVKQGDTLFLNDGFIQLEVVKTEGTDVICRVRVGGELRSRKSLNLPGIELGISAFTDRDHECLKFALQNGVDAVSQSFVEKASDIQAVRKAASDLGYSPFIIAKIERSRALQRIDEIIDASDGIMIARGDLGVEVPIEQIALVQKDLMWRANMRAKPVVTATQMLESMTNNSRPTRAEATDVANAILDGTDCVMLSDESAMGEYPIDAVAMLVKIAVAAEPRRRQMAVREMFQGMDMKGKLSPTLLIAMAVEANLEYISPAAVFVPTKSGATARSIARFRLPVWIVGVSSREAICRTMQFSYGVFPVHEEEHPDTWNAYVKKWVKDHEVDGNLVILTEGPSAKHPEANHRMEVIDLNSGAGIGAES